VVLPPPDVPTTQTSSCSATSNEVSWTTSVSPKAIVT
jgi:hypothetical protein